MFFGFQSEKALANAERLVQQGKFAAAIEIYEKLVEQQPGTLSLKNNLGDLYVQVGRTQKALELFALVAEYLENEGLHSRAIAVMKKMLKLDSSQLELQQRLARMLTTQGMMGESRSLWIAILERAEQTGNWTMAEECLSQLLAAEPESLLLLGRSAQLRQNQGDIAGAQQEWLKLGRKAIDRAALESVDEALRRLHQIDSEWLPCVMLRVRNELMRGHAPEALALIPPDELLLRDAAIAAEAWRVALDAHSLAQARTLARLAVQAGDGSTPVEFGRALLRHGAIKELIEWVSGDLEWFQRPDLQEGWRELLDSVLRQDPDNLKALRAWLELASLSDQTVRPSELLSRRQRFAELSRQNGDLLTSLEQYRHLVRLNPANAEGRRAITELEEQLGIIVQSAAEPAAAQDAESALAGADLAPTPTEMLAAAGLDEELAEFSIGDAHAGAIAGPGAGADDFLDLEDEWAEIADQDLEDHIQQIQFFAANGMLPEARQALDEELSRLPHEPRLQALDSVLRARLESEADAVADPAEVFSLTPLGFDSSSAAEPGDADRVGDAEPASSLDWLTAPEVEPAPAPVARVHGGPGLAAAALLPMEESPAGEELLLGALPDSGQNETGEAPPAEIAWGDWLHAEAEPPVPPVEPKVSEWVNKGSGGEAARLLDDLFHSFRQTVEGSQPASSSDPEHQYNMGIAYYEMGLFEEAIAELQKSFLGWEGQPVPPRDRLLSCGSTIALSFQQVNMPEVALTWYRRTIDAARLPAAESIGLFYEEGRLLEQLGRRQEALECYRQVYATDIDYQDVADCLKRLQMAAAPPVA